MSNDSKNENDSQITERIITKNSQTYNKLY